MISFTIPGEPQGKARARTGYNPKVGKVTSKTPEKTVNYEALIKQIYTYESKGNKVYYPKDKALELSIKAFYSIPKSVSKKSLSAMIQNSIRPTKKPDADNVLKIVADALNKIAYDDDTQLVKATVEKYYAAIPRVEVELREVNAS